MDSKIIDDFLMIDLCFVMSLMFIDWALGPAQRKVIKERVADWYVYLADVRYGAMMQSDAIKIRVLFFDWIGLKFFSGKRFFTSTIPSILALLSAFYVLELPFVDVKTAIVFCVCYFPFLILSSLVLLFLTHLILNFISYSSSFIIYILVVIAVIIVSAIIIPMVAVLVTYPVVLLMGSVTSLGHVNSFDLFFFIAVCGYFFILPLQLYLAFTYYLIFSKATGMILRGPVSLIALRLYESEKGVLGQIALLAGGVAKLVQETYKYFNG